MSKYSSQHLPEIDDERKNVTNKDMEERDCEGESTRNTEAVLNRSNDDLKMCWLNRRKYLNIFPWPL